LAWLIHLKRAGSPSTLSHHYYRQWLCTNSWREIQEEIVQFEQFREPKMENHKMRFREMWLLPTNLQTPCSCARVDSLTSRTDFPGRRDCAASGTASWWRGWISGGAADGLPDSPLIPGVDFQTDICRLPEDLDPSGRGVSGN
jgi:hypothetical protein